MALVTNAQAMTPLRDNATSLFFKGFYESMATSLAGRVDDGIQRVTQAGQPVWVDSRIIGHWAYKDRLLTWTPHHQGGSEPYPSEQQTIDYVQHLFREAEYVCRYAHEGHYLVHPWAECSPQCREHRTQFRIQREKLMRRIAAAMTLCPDCFLAATLAWKCPSCEKDLTPPLKGITLTS